MKFSFCLLFLFIACAYGYTQDLNDEPNYIIARSTLGLSGSSSTIDTGKGSYTLNQSVGQASIIGTSIINNHTLLQGYQQYILTLEVPKSEKIFQVLVGPNPVTEWLKIIFEETITDEVIIHLLDLSGRVIKTKKYTPSQILRLSLKDLTKGMYIIHVISPNKQFTTKLIKQ